MAAHQALIVGGRRVGRKLHRRYHGASLAAIRERNMMHMQKKKAVAERMQERAEDALEWHQMEPSSGWRHRTALSFAKWNLEHWIMEADWARKMLANSRSESKQIIYFPSEFTYYSGPFCNMNNKNMRRNHRVHQPGFDTQRRPIKN